MRFIKLLKCFITGHAWVYHGWTTTVDDQVEHALSHRFCTRCEKVEHFNKKFPIMDDSTSSADPEQISG